MRSPLTFRQVIVKRYSDQLCRLKLFVEVERRALYIFFPIQNEVCLQFDGSFGGSDSCDQSRW